MMNLPPLTTQPTTNGPTPEYLAQVLRQARLRIETLEERDHAPLAVIGIGCRFPGAASPGAFWQNLLAGHDAITAIPDERWDAAALYTATPTPGKMSTRWGGFLAQIDKFDAHFFGISGLEARAIDPQQRLLLEVAWEAIEAAGINPHSLAGSQTGVFIGISGNDYVRLQRGTPHESTAYAGVGNALSIAANRISYVLDLHGPSLAIDTACSSSLVAVHHACQSLRRGECDQALVGGVNLMLSPAITVAFSQAGMMAADGRCKTFDAGADGYVRSEGAGVVLLKRLRDAERDGDPILAVIAGSAINQDGRSNGLTAPNGLAQQAVIRQALHAARVVPAQISYVETHGTGTALGDPIEVNALKAVLLAERSPGQPCWLGAVKANIGHLEAAAGIASLIKTMLALHHQQIPRQLHVQTVNPHIVLAGTGLAIPQENQPWPRGATPRFAGVSSFGFGGANAHLILTEAPSVAPVPASRGRIHQLFTLSAKSQPALRSLAHAYAIRLAADPTLDLADLCFSANTGRAHFAHRLALVANDTSELQAGLAAFAAGQATPAVMTNLTGAQQPRLAFLFTGQGVQLLTMGHQLYATQPLFRDTLQHCDAILQPLLGHSLIELLYPPDQADGEQAATLLADTTYAQPALFALEYALAQLWLAWGIKPDLVLGHSVGELVAACVAGAFSLEEGLWLVAMRGRLMGSLGATGAMAAIFADAAEVSAALQQTKGQAQLALAAVNGVAQTVVAGE
jgi:acyl transferase domain-containing protein